VAPDSFDAFGSTPKLVSDITASVVLYKTPAAQILRLYECLAKSSSRPYVYLIDNSPAPTTLPFETNRWVTYFHSKVNLGYGAGHNIALRKVLGSSRFHFVLNPDTFFGVDELAKMLEFMARHPDVGQLMPKVIYPDGSLQYLCKLLPTPADLFLRRFMVGPLRRLVQKQIQRFELRFTGYDRAMDVPYLSGCFMLFRTSALRQIGLFDERFFMYPEDIDITRRVNARFRTLFFPGATIVHDHGRESYKNARALWVHMSNLVKYFNKWGWFHDPARSKVNRETLQRFHAALSDGNPEKTAVSG
jgi:GT2 family glycosyltransferase